MTPSEAWRLRRLSIPASPFLRRIPWAFSKSPSASWSAFLHSIIPAPVISRSRFTVAAAIRTGSAIGSSALRHRRLGNLGLFPGGHGFPFGRGRGPWGGGLPIGSLIVQGASEERGLLLGQLQRAPRRLLLGGRFERRRHGLRLELGLLRSRLHPLVGQILALLDRIGD